MPLKNNLRSYRAALLTALLIAVAVACVQSILGGELKPKSFAIALAATLPTSFILAASHISLTQNRRATVWVFMIGAAFIGLICGLALPAVFSIAGPSFGYPHPLLSGDARALLAIPQIFIGAAIGLVFWNIRRPDRDPPTIKAESHG